MNKKIIFTLPALLLAGCLSLNAFAEDKTPEVLPAPSQEAAVRKDGAKDLPPASALPAPEKKEETEKKKEKLAPIWKMPIDAADFALRPKDAKMTPGTPLADFLTAVRETPLKTLQNGPRMEYAWKNFSVLARKNGDGTPVITEIFTETTALQTARSVRVGETRENLLRLYGAPSRILWDEKAARCYAIYEYGGERLAFTFGNNQVKQIRLSEKTEALGKEIPSRITADTKARFPAEDFRLAGYRVGDLFQERPNMLWEKKATNKEEEIWYYGGFAVRMQAKTKRIESVFLTDSRMMTHRGLAIGDDVSTLECLYGEPEKVELNEIEGDPQVVYIYFSHDKELVLLCYINEKDKKMRNILVMKNPQAKAMQAQAKSAEGKGKAVPASPGTHAAAEKKAPEAAKGGAPHGQTA